MMRAFAKSFMRQSPVVVTRRVLIGSFAVVSTISLYHKKTNNFGFFMQTAHAEQKLRNQLNQLDLVGGNPQTSILYMIYDSRIPTQNEFMNDIEQKNVIDKLEQLGIQIVQVDAAKQNVSQICNPSKVSRKDKPTFLLRAQDSLHKIAPKKLIEEFPQGFEQELNRVSTNKLIWSVKDLSEALKHNNTKLDSLTVVYVYDKDKFDDVQTAIRMIRHESQYQVLELRDVDLAEKLNMKPGHFYGYYKPSYVNGYEQFLEMDFNLNYLQAFEGTCREELIVKYENISGLKQKLVTESVANENFEKVFKRQTSNVVFHLNPNMRSFRRVLKQETAKSEDQKPIIFIYSPELYFSRSVRDFVPVIKQYQEIFDVYVCTDEDVVKEYFYTHDAPSILPFVVIIDPKRRVPLKKLKDPRELVQVAGTQPIEFGSHVFKTQRRLMYDKIPEHLKKFIENFLDDESQLSMTSEKMQQATRVKEICATNFEKEVIQNQDFNTCIIEVFKHDCPSCAYNGKVFNVFSRKIEKHGYAKDLPCFRVQIDNRVPYMGNFGYSPMYFFLRKDDKGNIIESYILSAPQKSDQFISKIGELSGIADFAEKIKIQPRPQVMKFYGLQDQDADFDIDWDLSEELKA